MRVRDDVVVSVLLRTDAATAFTVFTEEVDLWWRHGPAYRFLPGARAGGIESAKNRLVFEPGLGGRFLEISHDSGHQHGIGRILVWEPPEHLAFSWCGPNFAPGEETLVDVRFEAVSNATDGPAANKWPSTRVTLRHAGWSSLPEEHPVRHGRGAEAFYRSQAGWWHKQFGALRSYVASNRSRE